MRLPNGRHAFSAALTPAGVYVVGYRETARGIEVSQYGHRSGTGPDPRAASRALGEMIEAQGGRGGRVSLAVSGFGSCHHILTLPAASRDVLLPVIGRELRRVFPGLFSDAAEEPIIEYVEIDSSGIGREGTQRELLTAAVPRSLIRTVRDELATRDVGVTHWTILPRAMQRLYDAFAGGDGPSAALVVAEGLSLLGFFQAGELRLFSETAATARDGAAGPGLIERVERGGLYLRQQFQGASLERVLLAAGANSEAEALERGLEDRLGIEAERFGPYSDNPGAMLALGGALDAAAGDPFDLLPPDLRPLGRHDRWTRLLAVASLAIVLAAAGWWAWSGVRAERAAEARFEEARAAVDGRRAELRAVRTIVDARRSHAQRAELLSRLLAGRERLPAMLWPLEQAPAGVRIDSLEILPSDNGWTARVRGTAIGNSTARATAAVDALFQNVRRDLPAATVSVDEISPPEPVGRELSRAAEFVVPIAITFRMTFIVPAVEEAVR